ncbi:hypothetical protein [Mycobacterium xenopi]
MPASVGVFDVSTDVLLDERRKCGFAKVAVPIDSGVNHKVDVVGVSAGPA